MAIKNTGYIVIQRWMVDELNLKGNELLVYAVINGFSQDGESRFTGSLQYLADWTNSTKRGIQKTLKSLTEKGLIEKYEKNLNGVKFCEYSCTEQSTGVWNSVRRGIELSSQGYRTEFAGGMELSSTNNINNNINDNLKNNKDKATTPQKHKYGEYENVLLSDDDLEKLQSEFPNDWQERIEKLSSYIESTGKKYKNHLATIRNWNRMDQERKPAKNKKPDYDDIAGCRYQPFM